MDFFLWGDLPRLNAQYSQSWGGHSNIGGDLRNAVKEARWAKAQEPVSGCRKRGVEFNQRGLLAVATKTARAARAAKTVRTAKTIMKATPLTLNPLFPTS